MGAVEGTPWRGPGGRHPGGHLFERPPGQGSPLRGPSGYQFTTTFAAEVV